MLNPRWMLCAVVSERIKSSFSVGSIRFFCFTEMKLLYRSNGDMEESARLTSGIA